MGDRALRDGLARLSRREDLPRNLMTEILREIMSGGSDVAQVGGFLVGLAVKGETMEEIIGAAIAMREAAVRIPSMSRPLLDTCGTGGSGVARRNVSTAVALALAACGVKVAKHGNRGASSPTGSADVLEALGVDISAGPDTVARCIDVVGVGFLFAAGLHPAMKHAVAIRRSLGIRTIFNLLGPLTNPAGAERQLLGVFDPGRAEDLAGALGALGSERVLVVHGFRAGVPAGSNGPAGIDDVSPEGETLVAEWHRGRVTSWVLTPEMARLPRVAISELAGETPRRNAAALMALLDGERGPYRTAVQLSGSAALLAAESGTVDDLPDYARRVGEAIDSGAARRVLNRLVATTRGEP